MGLVPIVQHCGCEPYSVATITPLGFDCAPTPVHLAFFKSQHRASQDWAVIRKGTETYHRGTFPCTFFKSGQACLAGRHVLDITSGRLKSLNEKGPRELQEPVHLEGCDCGTLFFMWVRLDPLTWVGGSIGKVKCERCRCLDSTSVNTPLRMKRRCKNIVSRFFCIRSTCKGSSCGREHPSAPVRNLLGWSCPHGLHGFRASMSHFSPSRYHV